VNSFGEPSESERCAEIPDFWRLAEWSQPASKKTQPAFKAGFLFPEGAPFTLNDEVSVTSL
jgi:hypothetical protein